MSNYCHFRRESELKKNLENSNPSLKKVQDENEALKNRYVRYTWANYNAQLINMLRAIITKLSPR